MDEERKGYLELILFSLAVGLVGIFVKLVQDMELYSIVFSGQLLPPYLFSRSFCFRKGLRN